MTNNEQMYMEEIRLSRNLTRTIDQEVKQWGQVVPHSVMVALNKLKEHYKKEQEQGVM